jgi:hypothetical protein
VEHRPGRLTRRLRRPAGGQGRAAPDPGRFGRALAAYLAFEEQSSGHAVWLLADLGHGWAVRGYTLFFQADLAAMTVFHQTGAAPKWPEFYPAFANQAARGEVQVPPFEPRPVPNFRAARIEHQDVVREEDGQA